MQEYVQKSISTTLPRRELRVRGGELSHAIAPLRSGIGPSSPRTGEGAGAGARRGSAALTGTIPGVSGPIASIKCVSTLEVFTKENFVSRFVSHPSAIAATPMITATPRARRIHTSKNRDRFIAENTLLPARSAIPREVAAPRAKDRSKK